MDRSLRCWRDPAVGDRNGVAASQTLPMRVTGARHEPTTAAGSFDYIAIGFYAPTGWKAGWDDRRMLPDWRADKELNPVVFLAAAAGRLG
jgi:hypothetical protein